METEFRTDRGLTVSVNIHENYRRLNTKFVNIRCLGTYISILYVKGIINFNFMDMWITVVLIKAVSRYISLNI
jgi:hypothetical protein